ncbi:putative Protein kinase domain-containing protein [Seiridium cardinale]
MAVESEIREAMIDDIIAIGDLRRIWDNNRLRRFVGAVNAAQLRFVRKYLLRTISLLAYIGANNYSSDIVGWIQNRDKWDERLHQVENSGLGWLGAEFRGWFLDARQYFTAPILTEGEDMELHPRQKLPWGRQLDVLGGGMNGDVTKHEIASGHLELNNCVGYQLTASSDSQEDSWVYKFRRRNQDSQRPEK